MDIFQDSQFIGNLVNTAVVLIGIFLARAFLIRAIGHGSRPKEVKQEWKTYIKSISHVLLFLGLLIVWGSELRAFAISLVAIAAAIVIATKELILCLMGGILKSMTRPFKVGDRIEIGGFRGDVMSHDLLVTSLFEIGPGRLSHQYTGRRVVLPNSLILGQGLVNETKRFKYGLHAFTVSLPISIDILAHQNVLLEAAEKVCGQWIEDAQQSLIQVGHSTGLEAPNAHPRVSVAFSKGDSVDLVVRIPIPALRSAKAEQDIIQEYVKNRPGAGVQLS